MGAGRGWVCRLFGERNDDFTGPPETKPLARDRFDGVGIAAQVLDGLAELEVFLPEVLNLGGQLLNLAVLGAALEIPVVSRKAEQEEREGHRHAARREPCLFQFLPRIRVEGLHLKCGSPVAVWRAGRAGILAYLAQDRPGGLSPLYA